MSRYSKAKASRTESIGRVHEVVVRGGDGDEVTIRVNGRGSQNSGGSPPATLRRSRGAFARGF